MPIQTVKYCKNIHCRATRNPPESVLLSNPSAMRKRHPSCQALPPNAKLPTSATSGVAVRLQVGAHVAAWYRLAPAALACCPLGPKLLRPGYRGLHSSTSQLNLRVFYGIGGARRNCVARVKGVLGGV